MENEKLLFLENKEKIKKLKLLLKKEKLLYHLEKIESEEKKLKN